jgi:hypothetical protein
MPLICEKGVFRIELGHHFLYNLDEEKSRNRLCRKPKRIGFTVMSPDILKWRNTMFKRMQRGASLVEWVVVVVIVVGILGAAALTIAQAGFARSGVLANWIDDIPVP